MGSLRLVGSILITGRKPSKHNESDNKIEYLFHIYQYSLSEKTKLQ